MAAANAQAKLLISAFPRRAAIGFVTVFCGAVNSPIASAILAIEVFGSEGLMLFALACSVSFMMSGRYSLYVNQKIVYSKIEGLYVNDSTI